MALARRSHTAYAPLFGPISEADAAGEPDYDQLFTEPNGSPYPKTTIRTTVQIDGLMLDITLNDMSITEAVQLLKRRGATAPTPAAPVAPVARPAKRRRRTHPTEPTFDLVWSDFDDEPPDAGHSAKVIELATLLMADRPMSWSVALATASQTYKENLQ